MQTKCELDVATVQKPAMQAKPECVLEIRGKKVMLDRDVAASLGVEPREVNQNAERSPKWDYLRQQGREVDYRFQLEENDMVQLRSQIVTSNYSRVLPWVYTRKGCAYLATSMNSSEACAQAVSLVAGLLKTKEIISDYQI